MRHGDGYVVVGVGKGGDVDWGYPQQCSNYYWIDRSPDPPMGHYHHQYHDDYDYGDDEYQWFGDENS